MRTKHARVRTGGFTILELMIVVLITGVLAAIAIPTFITYIYKSRTSEAVSFLGVIKLKQEAYRSEFGAYFVCSGRTTMAVFGTAANFSPAKASSSPRDISVSWSPSTITDIACFNTLGASPDGPIRFRYAWIAGTPADFAASGANAATGLAAADDYMVAQGHADLDDDGNWCTFELTNVTRNVWIGPADPGAPSLSAGWE